jgi:hypothetical protein
MCLQFTHDNDDDDDDDDDDVKGERWNIRELIDFFLTLSFRNKFCFLCVRVWCSRWVGFGW